MMLQTNIHYNNNDYKITSTKAVCRKVSAKTQQHRRRTVVSKPLLWIVPPKAMLYTKR